MWDYTEKTKEHFLNPRNVGFIDDFDGIGEVGSLACGDALKLTFKLGDDQRIADAKLFDKGGGPGQGGTDTTGQGDGANHESGLGIHAEDTGDTHACKILQQNERRSQKQQYGQRLTA